MQLARPASLLTADRPRASSEASPRSERIEGERLRSETPQKLELESVPHRVVGFEVGKQIGHPRIPLRQLPDQPGTFLRCSAQIAQQFTAQLFREFGWPPQRTSLTASTSTTTLSLCHHDLAT
jgi:hypothetical protein